MAGMRALGAWLREVDAAADEGPAGLPEPSSCPPVVRVALADLADAVDAGSVAIHEEVEVLAAFVAAAVEAYEHLDRSAVSGRRP